MPKEALVAAALAVWVLFAGLTTLLMAHRGHSWFQWAVIGGTLGPLSWPLVAYVLLTEDRPAVAPPMDVDVLVAVPPWIPAVEPMLEAVRGVEPLARTATLASVLDVEDATTATGRVAAADLDALMDRCGHALVAEGLVEPPVERRILYGRPADELARFADAGGFRAIVLGPDAPRCHPLLHRHTRARLQRRSGLPVLSPRGGQVTA
jgi:hypothetical protein